MLVNHTARVSLRAQAEVSQRESSSKRDLGVWDGRLHKQSRSWFYADRGSSKRRNAPANNTAPYSAWLDRVFRPVGCIQSCGKHRWP